MSSNRFKALLFSFLVLFGVFTGSIAALAKGGDAGMIKDLADGIVAFKLSETGSKDINEWITGALADGAGSTSEWYAVALSQYGVAADFTPYTSALNVYLGNSNIASAATRQRYAIALLACGDKSSGYIASTLADSFGKQGIMSWIFGLHLLNNGCLSLEYNADEIIDEILSLRLPDGGWALTGNSADVDITSMAIQSLAPYYGINDDVSAAVDGAVALLSGKQLADGSFSSYGAPNAESTAQVIIALTSVGIDPLTDARFNKNGATIFDGLLKYRLNDGSFCHTEGGGYNHTATVQAFCSLVALWRFETGRGPLYMFDSISATDNGTESHTEDANADGVTQAVTTDGETGTGISPESIDTQLFAGYKLWASIFIVAAACVICVIFYATKRRNVKNYLFIAAVAAVLLVILFATDFQSAGDYYGSAVKKTDATGTVTLTIRCDTVVGKADYDYIPDDGTILPATEFEIAEGDTVYDILVEAARGYNIQTEFEGNTANDHSHAYVSGINYLYEFSFGDLSGWIYRVNGTTQSVSCGSYKLADGDVVEWLYSCELGNDLDQPVSPERG